MIESSVISHQSLQAYFGSYYGKIDEPLKVVLTTINLLLNDEQSPGLRNSGGVSLVEIFVDDDITTLLSDFISHFCIFAAAINFHLIVIIAAM